MSRKFQRSQATQRNQTQQTLEESFGEINLNIDEQVNDLVRYIVNRAGQHMAFKRAELRKHVFPKAGPYGQEIIDKAAAILKNVYGYNMIVVDPAPNSAKSYIISNALPYIKDPTENVDDGGTQGDYPEDVNTIVLMLVLTHIYMSNNSVNEVSLYAFLKSLQIDVERRHLIFGNVKEYITQTLKNKKYLNIEMDQLSKKISFSWGERAEKEISKHELLKFVCKIYKERLPKSWVNQYKIADEQRFENHKEGLLRENNQILQ